MIYEIPPFKDRNGVKGVEHSIVLIYRGITTYVHYLVLMTGTSLQ